MHDSLRPAGLPTTAGAAVLCAALLIGVLSGACGSTSGPSEPYDINGTWLVTTTGGGVVGVSTNVFSGSRTSGSVIRGQFVGTYAVSGTSVIWSVATQSFQGALDSNTSMSGSFTSSTRNGTWLGTRQ